MTQLRAHTTCATILRAYRSAIVCRTQNEVQQIQFHNTVAKLVPDAHNLSGIRTAFRVDASLSENDADGL